MENHLLNGKPNLLAEKATAEDRVSGLIIPSRH